MALILTSGLIGDFRGHLLGSVIKMTRGGLSIAAPTKGTGKKAPTLFNLQQKVPSVSRLWSTLTQAQRQAWDSFAASRPIINNLAQVTHYTGHMTFVMCNLNLAMVAQPQIDAPKLLTNIVSTEITSFVADTQTGLMTIVANPLNQGNTSIILAASPPYSAGISKRPRVMKAIGVLPPNQASPGDISALYEAMFGEGWLNNIGSKIMLEITCIDNASGIQINQFVMSTIIQNIVVPPVSAWTIYVDNPMPGVNIGDIITNTFSVDSQIVTAVDNGVNPNVTLTDFSGLWLPGNPISFSSGGGPFAVQGVTPVALSPWWQVTLLAPYSNPTFHGDQLLNNATLNYGAIYMIDNTRQFMLIENMLGPVQVGDSILHLPYLQSRNIMTIVSNG